MQCNVVLSDLPNYLMDPIFETVLCLFNPHSLPFESGMFLAHKLLAILYIIISFQCLLLRFIQNNFLPDQMVMYVFSPNDSQHYHAFNHGSVYERCYILVSVA